MSREFDRERLTGRKAGRFGAVKSIVCSDRHMTRLRSWYVKLVRYGTVDRVEW